MQTVKTSVPVNEKAILDMRERNRIADEIRALMKRIRQGVIIAGKLPEQSPERQQVDVMLGKLYKALQMYRQAHIVVNERIVKYFSS